MAIDPKLLRLNLRKLLSDKSALTEEAEAVELNQNTFKRLLWDDSGSINRSALERLIDRHPEWTVTDLFELVSSNFWRPFLPFDNFTFIIERESSKGPSMLRGALPLPDNRAMAHIRDEIVIYV